MYKPKSISIIICTKDRYNDLKDCLQSFTSVIVGANKYEFVVVDSTTNKEIRGKVEEECQKYGAKYYYEPRKGLSIARNTAIEKASGDIVVFLDDDFIIPKDCIDRLIANFSDSKVMCVTGRMLSYRHDELSNFFEKHMSYDRGESRLAVTAKDMTFSSLFSTAFTKFLNNKKRSTPPYSVGFGFCSFKKSVFASIGGFDPQLGRGTPQMGSDDVDIFYRVLKAGYTIVYEPSALIYHNHRHSMEELVEYGYSSGVSIKSFTKKYFLKDPYIFSLFLGNILLTLSMMGKAKVAFDNELSELGKAQMRGYFKKLSSTFAPIF